jgi:hypothetical protein
LPQLQCNNSISDNLTTFQQICQSQSFSALDSCNPGFFGTGSATPQIGICSVIDNLPGWMRCDLDFNQFVPPN